MGSGLPNGNILGRVWSFAQCEYDEIQRKLWVRGKLVEVQDKPLDVLVRLLEADGDAVTKDDLLDAVWEDSDGEEGSLTTAVRTLRRAFGEGEREAVIRTLHRVGYQIAVPIECRIIQESVHPEFRLAAGEFVPGKPDWRLVRPLDSIRPHWIWLAEQLATRRTRVFKFAEDGVRYAALKRELTAARWLELRAPDPASFVKVDDWRLTTKPYYLAAEYGGTNLVEWVEAQRKAEGFSSQLCLEVMADVCDAVEQAHNLGLVHNDLKPSNILVRSAQDRDLRWRVMVADFGVATLANPARLAEADLTNHGFVEGSSAPPGGTALYRAPEVSAGGAATQRADLYALGVIFFQLLCGDFTQIPTPGWQDKIDDLILRDDIAEAVSLDPAARMPSAAEFARRLRILDVRRQEAQLQTRRQQQAEDALERAKLQRARQPYLWAAMIALFAGLCVSLWFYRKAVREEKTAARINAFLTEDLLRQSNPNVGRGLNETLNQAIQDVSPQIETRFQDDPRTAATVHQTLALALDDAEDSAASGKEFDAAAAAYIRADGPLSQDAIYEQLQHAFLEARSFRPGSLDRAQALLTQQSSLLQKIPKPAERLLFVQREAQGMVAAASGDTKTAVQDFAAGVDLAGKSNDVKVEDQLTARQRLCSIKLRAGEPAYAETCFRDLVKQVNELNGANSVSLPIYDFGIAQALLFQSKFHEAIAEVNADLPYFVHQLGPDNTMTQQLLGIRSQAEGELEEWDDSIRDSLALAAYGKKTEPTGFFAVGALSDAALSECRAGRFASGEAHGAEALGLVSSPGQNPGMIGVVKFTAANCIILAQMHGDKAAGALARAEQLLGQIDIPATSSITADPGWGANIDLATAQIAYLQGLLPKARASLAKAAPAFAAPAADRYQHDAVKDLAGKLVQPAAIGGR